MKKEQFDITGMTCAACSSRVEGGVVKLPELIVNGRYFKVGFHNLLKSSPNMDSLIAIGSGAAAVSEFMPPTGSPSAWGKEIWNRSIPL